MITLLGISAAAATMLGGLFALRFRDRLHLILGFSAGALVGVAILDLLPEALEMSDGDNIFLLVALGFLGYLTLDRIFILRFCEGKNCKNPEHRGELGAATLSVHSFLDGVAIGVAVQVSLVAVAAVTIAVLAHKFSDGINTVGLILKNSGSRKKALNWLAISSLAPILGVATASFFTLGEKFLGIVLAIFAGFFIYIGASDLLPESHHAHPTRWTTVMTILGVLVVYGVIRLAE